MSRRAIGVLLVLLVAGSVSFAAGRQAGGTEEGALSGSIKWVTYHTTNTENAYIPTAEAYMRVHPEVKIEIEVIPQQQYYDVIRTQLLSGTAPEIVTGKPGITDELADKGVVADWEEFIFDDTNPYTGKTFRESIEKGSQDGWRSAQGKIHMLMYFKTPEALKQNTTILEDNGLSTPKTYRQFMTALQKLKAAGYEAPFPFQIHKYEGISNLLMVYILDAAWRKEFALVNYDPTNDTWDPTEGDYTDVLRDAGEVLSSKEKIAAFKSGILDVEGPALVWAKVVESFLPYMPEGLPDYDAVGQMFWQQKSVFAFEGGYGAAGTLQTLSEMPSNERFDAKMIPFPAIDPSDFPVLDIPSRIHYTYLGVEISVPADLAADKVPLVKDFVCYMYSPDGAANMLPVAWGPPCVKGVALSGNELMDYMSDAAAVATGFRLDTYDQGGAQQWTDLQHELRYGRITPEAWAERYAEITEKEIYDKLIRETPIDLAAEKEKLNDWVDQLKAEGYPTEDL